MRACIGNIFIMKFISYLIFTFAFGLPHSTKNHDIIVIDNDAGADDAWAIYLMFRSELCKCVHSITTVKGNSLVENVVLNNLKTLSAINEEVPVYLGSSVGLSGFVPGDFYFGNDGFGDFIYKGKVNKNLVKMNAVDHLINIVSENVGKVRILATGPLTNIAKAGMKSSTFFSDLKELVIMGGAYLGGGSIGGGIEYNFHQDPRAAAYVLNRELMHTNITLLPYESCMNMSLTFRKHNLPSVLKITEFFDMAERKSLAKSKVWLVCDQLAAIAMLDPSAIIDTENVQPNIEEGTGKMTVSPGNQVRVIKSMSTKKVKLHFLQLDHELNKSINLNMIATSDRITRFFLNNLDSDHLKYNFNQNNH